MTDKLVKRLRERADATRRALLQERTNLYDEAADALENAKADRGKAVSELLAMTHRAEKAEAERDELKEALHRHYDLAPQRYAAAKEALPILERSMRCPFCNEEFADGVLHDTGLALINTFDRMTKAKAECERLRTLLQRARWFVKQENDACVIACPEDPNYCCADTLTAIDAAMKDQP